MNYANWITRVGAYLIDGLVILPFVAPAAILDARYADPETGASSGGGPIYWILIAAALVLNAYNRWYLAGKTGRSWGKKALGISLVKEDTGRPIGAGMAFLRDIAHFVDGIICYIGYLFPLWDSKRQTLADKIVRTVVVKD